MSWDALRIEQSGPVWHGELTSRVVREAAEPSRAEPKRASQRFSAKKAETKTTTRIVSFLPRWEKLPLRNQACIRASVEVRTAMRAAVGEEIKFGADAHAQYSHIHICAELDGRTCS